MVLTWAKDYVKHDGHNVELIHIFLRQWSHRKISFGKDDIQLHIKNITLSL